MEQADDQHHFHIPLTEHDVARTAFIEPSQTISPQDVPSACVITFFGDVVDRLVERRGARVLSQNRWEDGPHPLLEIEHDGTRLAVLRSGVGAPLAGGLLEETIAMGCREFVVCGGAGTLHGELTLGHFVVVASAIRDEGTSYHYLPRLEPFSSTRTPDGCSRVCWKPEECRSSSVERGRPTLRTGRLHRRSRLVERKDA